MLPSNLLTASMAFVAFLQKAAWASQIVYDGKAESIAQQKRDQLWAVKHLRKFFLAVFDLVSSAL